MPDPPSSPVGASTPSTVATPFRRLRLGHQDNATVAFGLWTVWVPSNMGGRLKIEGAAGLTITIQRPAGTTLATGKGKATYDVPIGTWGEFVVTTVGATNAVNADFTQTYWSRQGSDLDAEPLIPYNFWYWPSKAAEGYALRAKNILAR